MNAYLTEKPERPRSRRQGETNDRSNRPPPRDRENRDVPPRRERKNRENKIDRQQQPPPEGGFRLVDVALIMFRYDQGWEFSRAMNKVFEDEEIGSNQLFQKNSLFNSLRLS